MAGGVNGPLLAMLAESCGFHDTACVGLFRTGSDIIGRLPCSGNGMPIDPNLSFDKKALLAGVAARNAEMLKRARVDPYSSDLVAQTRADAKLGRMTMPRPACELDLSRISVCQRFGMVQGRWCSSVAIRV